MARRLSKEESRQRYAEGRALWNEFDPIGVFQFAEDWKQDEYDGYIGPCLRIVIDGKGPEEIATYVRWVVFERMGLGETPQAEAAIVSFSEKFSDWYRQKWPDTEA